MGESARLQPSFLTRGPTPQQCYRAVATGAPRAGVNFRHEGLRGMHGAPSETRPPPRGGAASLHKGPDPNPLTVHSAPDIPTFAGGEDVLMLGLDSLDLDLWLRHWETSGRAGSVPSAGFSDCAPLWVEDSTRLP